MLTVHRDVPGPGLNHWFSNGTSMLDHTAVLKLGHSHWEQQGSRTLRFRPPPTHHTNTHTQAVEQPNQLPGPHCCFQVNKSRLARYLTTHHSWLDRRFRESAGRTNAPTWSWSRTEILLNTCFQPQSGRAVWGNLFLFDSWSRWNEKRMFLSWTVCRPEKDPVVRSSHLPHLSPHRGRDFPKSSCHFQEDRHLYLVYFNPGPDVVPPALLSRLGFFFFPTVFSHRWVLILIWGRVMRYQVLR